MRKKFLKGFSDEKDFMSTNNKKEKLKPRSTKKIAEKKEIKKAIPEKQINKEEILKTVKPEIEQVVTELANYFTCILSAENNTYAPSEIDTNRKNKWYQHYFNVDESCNDSTLDKIYDNHQKIKIHVEEHVKMGNTIARDEDSVWISSEVFISKMKSVCIENDLSLDDDIVKKMILDALVLMPQKVGKFISEYQQIPFGLNNLTDVLTNLFDGYKRIFEYFKMELNTSIEDFAKSIVSGINHKKQTALTVMTIWKRNKNTNIAFGNIPRRLLVTKILNCDMNATLDSKNDLCQGLINFKK